MPGGPETWPSARGAMPTDTMRMDEPAVTKAPRSAMTATVLALRLAAASAVIAALTLYTRPRLRPEPTEPPWAAAPFVPAAPEPAAPASAARLDLAEPISATADGLTARLDPQSGRREDTLTRGTFDGLEASAVRVTLSRGISTGPSPSLFVLIARRAADGPAIGQPALAVMRSGPHGVLDTKFGTVETLEVTLGGTVQRTCTGFVTRQAVARIDGWVCAPMARPPEARSLGCLLDALTLVDLGDPETMAAFSAAAHPGRICNPNTRVAEATGRIGSIAQRAHTKK